MQAVTQAEIDINYPILLQQPIGSSIDADADSAIEGNSGTASTVASTAASTGTAVKSEIQPEAHILNIRRRRTLIETNT